MNRFASPASFGRPAVFTLVAAMVAAAAIVTSSGLGKVAHAQTAVVTAVEYAQLDFYAGGTLVEANSDVGQFTVTYTPGSVTNFVNVLGNTGGPDQWLIQNLPLIPSDAETESIRFSATYDLGLPSAGIDPSSGSFCYQLAVSPISSPPSCTPVSGTPIGNATALSNSGVPSGVTAVSAPPGTVFDYTVPFVGLMVNWHPDMPNVVQGIMQCGPAAATNSLIWLAQQNGWALKNANLQDTLDELVNNMGTDNTGTWDRAFAIGKLKFAKDHAKDGVQITNHYVGGAGGTGPAGAAGLPTAGNFVDPNGNGVAIRDGNPSWAWIEQELDRGEDVEVMTRTHWVVLEGKVSWDSIHNVVYRDTAQTRNHPNPPTPLELADAAKRHSVTYMVDGADGKLHSNIGNGDEVILTAYAESPSSVGGIAQLPVDQRSAGSRADNGSGTSLPLNAAIAGGLAAAVLAVGLGGWFVRRRFVRR